ALEVIKEDTADAAHLTSMLQSEILVTPFLEPRIKLRIMSIARLLYSVMKMCRVFDVGIAGREIGPTAEPLRIAFFEISKIGVNRRNHRASRMKDERHARRK